MTTVSFQDNVKSLVQRGADLTLRQFAVLMEVNSSAEKATVRGLSATLRISKPAVTRAVDRLAQAGLVKRIPDGMDKRSVFIALTPEGDTLVASLA